MEFSSDRAFSCSEINTFKLFNTHNSFLDLYVALNTVSQSCTSVSKFSTKTTDGALKNVTLHHEIKRAIIAITALNLESLKKALKYLRIFLDD